MQIPRHIQYLLIGILLLLCAGGIAYYVGNKLLQRANDIPYAIEPYQTADGSYCNIAFIPLTGALWASQADADAQTATDQSDNTSGEAILSELERAKDDSSIQGVVLRVDSPGGSPTGGEMIANALKSLGKPSAAVIMDEGDSAAYLASTGANVIIASPFSDVADIGVTSSYVDTAGSDTQNGDQFVQVAAGKYKDVGNPNMPATAAGTAYLQTLVESDYQVLTTEIAQNRSIPLKEILSLADGNSLTGSMAMGTGLIDKLGDLTTAQQWFAQKLGKGSHPVLCN
jgi:protease-4